MQNNFAYATIKMSVPFHGFCIWSTTFNIHNHRIEITTNTHHMTREKIHYFLKYIFFLKLLWDQLIETSNTYHYLLKWNIFFFLWNQFRDIKKCVFTMTCSAADSRTGNGQEQRKDVNSEMSWRELVLYYLYKK